MKSGDIQGFSIWIDWRSLDVRQAPTKPGTYVLRLAGGKSKCRLMGESDIVYIGATKKGNRTVRDRLRDHLRLRRDLKGLGWRLERILQLVGPLEVAWKAFETHSDAQWEERELLDKYQEGHIEIPPLNRQETGREVSLAIKAFASKTPEEQAGIVAKVRALRGAGEMKTAKHDVGMAEAPDHGSTNARE